MKGGLHAVITIIRLQEAWVYKPCCLIPRLSPFVYFTRILTGQRRLFTIAQAFLNHPRWVSSDLDLKSEELLSIDARSAELAILIILNPTVKKINK